ncbi:sigma factor-like helix-turn-helix DNA-binding protein [Aeromicrobium piscarium]|uniref:Transcription factor WhiB n=1 Tax=Aeromicrobium piscarium TaxID=2590901 RepID=A0A554SDL8_9ACTN|nr:WhiB family transcriptional regulator [Aeromicrobium piscarium]TSD64435.1 transcription factor WhiB [Aeromicrobium piscarium]
MLITSSRSLPPCAMRPEVYQDEQLLCPPARHESSAEQWRDFQAKRDAAHRRCAGCEVLPECLYQAVVEVDVSGFVACTSERERQRMRRVLGIDGPLHDPTQDAPRSGGGPVDHDLVMATRRAHPDDTSRQLAERLGCSLSTVKRHLRRARETESPTPPSPVPPPTIAQVLDVFDDLEKTA